MAATKPARKLAKSSKGKGFSEAEKSAMRQRVKEVKSNKANGESVVREAIAAMNPTDRALAERLHRVIKASAPALSPTTWYGMPAYAREGKVVCFFQPAQKFKTRYATLGFNDRANLDEGAMWPVSFALTDRVTAGEESRIAALVKKAVG